MTDDEIELNLDTQARRLSELDDIIGSALKDEESMVELPETSHRQSYDELTAYNKQLRTQRGWEEVDLDQALTASQREAWENWLTKHRLEWRTSDYLAVGAAGLIGLLCCWFDSTIDRAVRDRLKGLKDTATLQMWESAGKRLPIDYMGPGFGGRAHRVKSAGHDLARPIEAIRQVMEGEFRGVRWVDGVPQAVDQVGRFRGPLPTTEAASRLGQHLLADVITEMSLPIPGMSLLYESDSTALRDFALHAYSGLANGTGWNIRNGIANPSMTVIVVEVLMRTYVHGEALHRTGTAELDWPGQRRRTELLLAAHGLVSAISLGKVTAQMAAHAATGDYLRALHPSHIRHANIPALLRTGTLAATAVSDAYRASQIPSARSWDELVMATAQPWQLGLIDRVEQLSDTDANLIGPLQDLA
ncbi:hypothetical protein M0655_02690 [Gordonia amicalis]|uniref:hypothetical protein n=1 Tax=Gordonia TaxID=2053 RepID=UPI00200A2B90|nr:MULTISPECIES: hypothetical protein [Gordonia]MCR8897209.1 hypothetical protein [Gordonia sp. GONU]UPW14545.1 hypothetical protein M0655_02690 [Gordonia amicalis]